MFANEKNKIFFKKTIDIISMLWYNVFGGKRPFLRKCSVDTLKYISYYQF